MGVGGAWTEPSAPAAIAGEPAVRLCFNLDRSAKDLASYFHLAHVSGRCILVRLVFVAKDAAYVIQWQREGANRTFTAIMQNAISADYHAAISEGPQRG